MSLNGTPELPDKANKKSLTPPIPNANSDRNDLEGVLRDKIDIDSCNILAYLELVQIYESKDQYDASRKIYEELHNRFPFYSPLWTLQLKGELQRDEFETVEKLLAQCLSGEFANNDIALWSTYLDYVRRRNNLITGGQEARAVVLKAFDLVLEKCAIFETRSSLFWSDYLSFLEQWKPVNKWEEQQRLDMIRKLYKKMLCVPFDNIEKMWNRYTQWEQEVNSLTARKFIGELSADYMKARSLYQEWSLLTKGLKRSTPSSLSTANKNTIPQPGETLDPVQLRIWLKWIEWEKKNKLELPDDVCKARTTYVYKQGIQHMLFSSEMWYDYAMYIADVSERQQILYTAVLANPASPSLTFKLAECYEIENNFEAVKKSYDECTQRLLSKYHHNTGTQDESSVYKRRKELTYVYCIYMNTMKRLSGLSAARTIFGKCRKLKNILTHDIYVENAYLEFQNQNDYKTACKVLELGLKYFQSDSLYINKYLDFLILINRDSQIKILFETSIDKLTDLTALKRIYKKMISYESKFGSLNNVYELEKRFFERFPEENLIETFTDRYSIQNQNLIKKLELTYMDDDASSLSDHYDIATQSSKRPREEDHNQASKKSKQGPLIPPEIIELLGILPKPQYFKSALLDPQSLINFLNEQVEVPELEPK